MQEPVREQARELEPEPELEPVLVREQEPELVREQEPELVQVPVLEREPG